MEMLLNFLNNPIEFLNIVGVILFIYVLLKTKEIFRKNKILMNHMLEVFTFLNSINVFAVKHKTIYTIIGSTLLLFIFGAFVYFSEQNHYMLYKDVLNYTEPVWKDLKSFIVWMVVFATSGYEQDIFPKSIFGAVIIGVVPLFFFALTLYMVKITSETDGGRGFLHKMATGQFKNYRVAIFNYDQSLKDFILNILNYPKVFIVIFVEENEFSNTKQQIDKIISELDVSDKIVVLKKELEIIETYIEYNIKEVNELYLFATHNEDNEHDNFKLISQLDYELYSKNIGLEEENSEFIRLTKLPRITIETSSNKYKILYDKIKSTILKDSVKFINFNNEVYDYLITNLDTTLGNINDYYWNNVIINKNTLLTLPEMSFGYANIDESKALNFREMFVSNVDMLEELYNDKEAHVISFLTTLITLQEELKVLGIKIEKEDYNNYFDLPSALLSSKSYNFSDFLLLQNTPPTIEYKQKEILGRMIFFFFDKTIKDFVNKIYHTYDVLPEQIVFIETNKPLLRNGDFYQTYEYDSAQGGFVGGESLFHFQENDILFILNDGKKDSTLRQVDLLEQLASSMDVLIQEKVLVMVESDSIKNKSLFETLFVDKIVFTYGFKENYLRTLSSIYHKDFIKSHQNENIMRVSEGYETATNIANLFSKFIIIDAKALVFNNSKDNAVDKLPTELAYYNQRYIHDGKLQFIGSFKLIDDTDDIYTLDYNMIIGEKRPIGEDEYLIFLPMI